MGSAAGVGTMFVSVALAAEPLWDFISDQNCRRRGRSGEPDGRPGDDRVRDEPELG